MYRLDGRSGSMHSKRSPIHEVQYGRDGERLFLRIDFHESKEETLEGMEIRLQIQGPTGESGGSLGAFGPGGSFAMGTAFPGAECAFQNILEASVPVAGGVAGKPVRFQFSLWKDGLPVDAIPQQGWLEASEAEK